jgi:hypothetical protein
MKWNLSAADRSNGRDSSIGFSCLEFIGAIWSFVGLFLTPVDGKLVVSVRCFDGGGTSLPPAGPNKPEKLYEKN